MLGSDLGTQDGIGSASSSTQRSRKREHSSCPRVVMRTFIYMCNEWILKDSTHRKTKTRLCISKSLNTTRMATLDLFIAPSRSGFMLVKFHFNRYALFVYTLLDWLIMRMLLDYAEHWHQTLKRSGRLPFFPTYHSFLPLPNEIRVQYGGDVSWYTSDCPIQYLTLPIPAYWELHVSREPGS